MTSRRLHQEHVCLLDQDPDRYQSDIPPNATTWQRTCERLRRIATISKRNPRCGDHFKSRAAVFKERQRQSQLPSIIHPFSRLAMYREVLMFFVWSLMFIIDPFYGTFVMSDYVMNRKALTHIIFDSLQLVLAVFVCGDIVVNFFLGYEASKTHEIILDRRRIVRRYLKTYFFFDFVAMVNAFMPADAYFFDTTLDVLVHQLFIFRVVRVGSVSNCFVFLLRLAEVPESIAQCINIVLSTVYILNWLTCLLAWVPLMAHVLQWSDEERSWTVPAEVTIFDDVPLTYKYMSFLLITMCHFYGASTGSYETTNVHEYLVFSFAIMIGIGYYTYAIAVIGQLFRTDNVSETMYMDLVAQVNQYSKNKKLTAELRGRLLQYCEAKFQRKYFNDYTILHALSEHLRLEVVLYSCKHMIDTVYMFKGLSRTTVGTIVGLLKQEIYLPGDVLASTDIPNTKFHFISYGTLALMLTPKEEAAAEEFEVMHMEDGDICGNSAGMWLHYVYNYRVVVLERSEIYSLPRSSWELCKTRFPDLVTVAKNVRLCRQEYIKKVIEAKGASTQQDILQELNRGKILLPGRKR